MKLRLFVAVFLCQLLGISAAFAATPTVKFATPTIYGSGGSGANFVVTADLNGDGFPDIIEANTSGVAVRLNNGDGTFGTRTQYPTGTNTFSVAVGDVNGDGIPDLVATNYCDPGCSMGNVSVLLGAGGGTFNPAVNYGAGGFGTEAIVIADFNGDGWPDLMVTTECQQLTCVDGSIRLLLNNADGTGTFTLTGTPIGPSKGGPLAVGDLNNDGNLDVVVAGGVFLGDGLGNFTQNTSVIIPGGAISIALADLNGDGNLDVVVANQAAVQVQLGNGDGTLKSAVTYKPGGGRPLSVAVADFNGDGRPDIAVVDECSSVTNGVCAATGALGVLAGNGDGTFQPPVAYTSGGYLATSVAVADVNGDTKPDILVSNACTNKTCPNGLVAVFSNIFKASVTVQVTSSLSPALINQPFNLMAAITSNVPIPDGSTVSFFYGASLLGSATTTSGLATLTGISFPAYGSHTITANYPTDLYHNAGSGQFTELVHRFPTTTTLMSGENPTDLGVKTVFTATVASNGGPTPTGSVQFLNGGNVVGTVTLKGGSASFTITFSVENYHTITANYLGDAESAPSTSDPLQELVQ